MMYNWGYGNESWVGALFMMLMWVAVIVVVILCIRYFAGRAGTSHQDSALDILKIRYAKGEIDKNEFEDKRKDLQG
jgi:putative membrane protein